MGAEPSTYSSSQKAALRPKPPKCQTASSTARVLLSLVRSWRFWLQGRVGTEARGSKEDQEGAPRCYFLLSFPFLLFYLKLKNKLSFLLYSKFLHPGKVSYYDIIVLLVPFSLSSAAIVNAADDNFALYPRLLPMERCASDSIHESERFLFVPRHCCLCARVRSFFRAISGQYPSFCKRRL